MKRLLYYTCIAALVMASAATLTGCSKNKNDFNTADSTGTGNPSVSGPATAMIRIRVVNRMEKMPAEVSGRLPGPLDSLYGPVTLTYADGTPVSPQTSNIAVGTASAYVEIPYGTYQFRMLTQDGRQVPADEENDRLFEPATSQMYSNNVAKPVSALTFATLQTYQPAGVYSFTVRPNGFAYYVPGYPPVDSAEQNMFLITADEIVTGNTRYAKLQAVNAMPGVNASFRIAGTPIGQQVAFGIASEYTTVEKGSHMVEAVDASGKVLATARTMVSAGQNISYWLWPAPDGSAQLTPVFNDLSTRYFRYNNPEFGIYNRRAADLLPTAIRFLNLCPDESNISFTIDDGQDARKSPMFNAAENVYEGGGDSTLYNFWPGKVLANFPYTRWIAAYDAAFNFQVFRSSPGIIPGKWAADITKLNSASFVANPSLYTRTGRDIPNLEPGIYTVALAGRSGNNGNAKMIIVKHNR